MASNSAEIALNCFSSASNGESSADEAVADRQLIRAGLRRVAARGTACTDPLGHEVILAVLAAVSDMRARSHNAATVPASRDILGDGRATPFARKGNDVTVQG